MSVAAALDYARDVLAGTVPACRLVHHACQRFLNDVARAERGEGQWRFRPDLAERVMRFVSLLPNIKGPLAGQRLRLMPWQSSLVAQMFGWVERGTTTRRFRQTVCFVSRGQGKSCLSAALLLYLAFADGEGGAECYSSAVTSAQARIVWDTAQGMMRQAPDLARRLGVEVRAHSLVQPKTSSKLVFVSSDAKSLEGLSVHGAVCDEIASHNDGGSVYNVLLTATGKRRHPMLISISTPTGNTEGVGKQIYDYAVRVLTGAQEDERLLALLYGIDEGDDPWSEATWRKANPGWGVSAMPDAIAAIMRQARQNPAQEAAAMTRHLGVWVGADEALFSTRGWQACRDPELHLDDFEGQEIEIGLDLASKTDLAAISIVVPRGDTYKAFSRCYLNEAAVMEARNAAYPGWANSGHITVTEGNETDFGRIEADLLDLCARFRVRSVGYDPWAATQLAQRLLAQGVPMVEYRMTTQNLSEPTKELSAAIAAKRIAHDGNPVLGWCLGNVVGRFDARENVYPKRARPEAKIDAAIALIMAIGRSMEARESSVYNDRGLLILSS